jgi:hypothetical protein
MSARTNGLECEGLSSEVEMLELQDSVHVQEDDLKLYVHGRLDAVHHFVVGHHLLECHTCREYLSLCIDLEDMPNPMDNAKWDRTNRRSEPRFTIGGELDYQEFSPFSVDRQKASVLDISANGVGIFTPNPVLPGTIVQIRVMNTVELGQVRHCSAFGDKGYRIGLRLHDGF